VYDDATWRLLEAGVNDAAASTSTLEKLYEGTLTVTGVDRSQQNLYRGSCTLTTSCSIEWQATGTAAMST